MFLSLHVYSLYGTIILTWFDIVFICYYYWTFAIKLNRIYIHSVNIIFFFLLLVWFLFEVADHSTSYTSADLSKVVDLATLCTFLTIGQALSGWMAGATIAATLLHGCLACVHGFVSTFLYPSLTVFILSKAFVSLNCL